LSCVAICMAYHRHLENPLHVVEAWDGMWFVRTSLKPDAQLLRAIWHPVSEGQLQTCMTLIELEQFHIVTLKAKTTMYDYYKSLEKLMLNDGMKPPDRYQVSLRIARKYCHLMMLKRGDRGHEPGGTNTTKSGELAVLCPACPWPSINLPEDWETAPEEYKSV
ncbi:hypothetical protein K438DRAFT_1508869, partial [Mycena galopus ATCC 62051]